MILAEKNKAYLSPYLDSSSILTVNQANAIASSEVMLRFKLRVQGLTPQAIEDLKTNIQARHFLASGLLDAILSSVDSSGKSNTPADATEARHSFDEAILAVERELFGVDINSLGRVILNDERLCRCLMKMVKLCVVADQPNVLLAYNRNTGIWDNDQMAIHRLLLEVVTCLYRGTLTNWSEKLEQALTARLLRSAPIKSASQFDATYFGMANADVDEFGMVSPHSPDHWLTLGSPVKYDSDAKCPAFMTFIKDLFTNDAYSVADTEASVDFVQEYFGYVLSASHAANVFLIAVSPGASGKSTLFGLLGNLVGEANRAATQLETLGERFGLMGVLGKKLALSTENAATFATEKIKNLTAGESVEVQIKNAPPIVRALPVKIVALMNQLPMLTDETLGWSRRVILLPFPNVYLGVKQDKYLARNLQAELEGILAWSVRGLQRLAGNKFEFTFSKPMNDIKSEYFKSTQPVLTFVNDCIVVVPGGHALRKDIFAAYKSWITDTKTPSRGTTANKRFWAEFTQALNTVFGLELITTESNGKRYVSDIQLQIKGDG